MRDIPFYANRDDSMSCMLAALRSALEYFDKKPYTWEKMEEITGYTPKKPAWTVQVWAYLVDHGFDIRMIEAFDYRRYQKEGENYLEEFLKPDELAWQLQHSNILEIQPLLPAFLEKVDYQQKSSTLDDIDSMLADGYLVFLTVNAQVINKAEGYSSHALLVHDRLGGSYLVHDSGPTNAQANRKIPRELLFKAMGGAGNTSEATGIKRKE